MMKVFEHHHPLQFIDLQVNDEDLEESDEEKDAVAQDEFSCPCKRCDQPINEYYRYCYKCIDDSCDYSLHKFCAEVPTTFKHTSHQHPLTLDKHPYHHIWECRSCFIKLKPFEVCYTCDDCYFFIGMCCAVEPDKKRIHHPSHPHPLMHLISKPILYPCNACGKEHKGIFFHCTTCSNFAVHTGCAFLPKSVLIQQATNGSFHHTHPLTLSYSFPIAEQLAYYYPTCRVCDGSFDWTLLKNLWIYRCQKCIYYAHVDCVTSRKEPFMSILSTRSVKTVKNFEDADYPHLFHLPFPNQTYSIPKHLFFKEIGPTAYDKVRLHHHELIFVNTKCIDGASSSSCHNPMKKIQLLCNACLRPIMEMPFYKCGANEDESCNFALHEWCTRLPTQVDNHPGHPLHTLFLMSNIPSVLFNIFHCDVCCLPCNGYAYGCVECHYYVDVTCGFIPEKITHKSHPNHLLSIDKITARESYCHMCRLIFPRGHKLSYSCGICDVHMHPECALFLPETITHAYDKHPMQLSYLPIENHKSEYFCEICECELNPHESFYHCVECVQSVHSACAPLILCCETETHSDGSNYLRNVYRFLNVKFGSIHKIDGHRHPLSLAQGTESDGRCSECSYVLQYEMIFKCLKCEFVIDYECCKHLNEKCGVSLL